MGRIRAVLSGAVEWGYIREVPKVRKMRETRKENTDFLTFDEASRLLSACAPGDIGSPYVWLALRAGLRVGEIRGLVWGDWDGRRLNVSRQVTKEGRVTGTKSGKGRSVPVPDDLKEYLDGSRNGAPDSAPIAYRGSATEGASALARLLKAAGISREGSSIGMHDLRHTYASHLAMKGVSLQVIQRLLGHADISMTQRYAHLLQGAVDEAVQVLSPGRHQ
ncbi:MAG: site-specific integrase [Akkermansia sp.]|nr:site-specific integrase [Akkermansia sp.]